MVADQLDPEDKPYWRPELLLCLLRHQLLCGGQLDSATGLPYFLPVCSGDDTVFSDHIIGDTNR